MPTQQQIQNLVLASGLEMANLIESDRLQMAIGGISCNDAKISRYRKNIIALGYQLNPQDYTSSNTLILYDCLNDINGLNTSTATIDPNYQAPNTVINIINEGGAITYTYDQTFLIDAGSGNWYLLYKKPDRSLFITQVPVQLTINGVSSGFTWDNTFSPSRIYGFANNLTQSIELTVI